jgi:hypothetical protein
MKLIKILLRRSHSKQYYHSTERTLRKLFPLMFIGAKEIFECSYIKSIQTVFASNGTGKDWDSIFL